MNSIKTHEGIKTRTLEEYNSVMQLRRENKRYGIVKISKITSMPTNTIRDWIYRGVKPKRLRKIKLIPEGAKILSPELAYILGVIEGDGCLCKSRRHTLKGECFDYILTLGVTDKDFAEYFTKQVKKWCNLHLYETKRPQHGKGYKDLYITRLRSKDAYEFLKSFDMSRINNAPHNIKAMFLKGFFDSEGHVSKDVKNGCISIGVANLKTLLLVRSLLESLGVRIGPLKERNLTDKKFYYFLIASKGGLKRYKDKIGFSINRKQERLIKILEYKLK